MPFCFPSGQLFEIHGSKLKPHPFGDLGQTSVKRIAHDNGMKLEPLYDGRRFPAYLHGTPQMMLEIRSGTDGETSGYLYLPCSDKQIQRTLERAGCGPEGFQIAVAIDELPPEVSAIVSPARDGIDEINALCRAVRPLSTEGRKKLGAVILTARPECASEVRQLAENLDQFDFVPRSDDVPGLSRTYEEGMSF